MKAPQQSPDFPDAFYRVAVKGLCVREGKVLLVHDYGGSDIDMSPKWELPGGGVDFGENFQDALKREGRTVEQAEKDFRKQAEERWSLRLGMAHLIEHKGVTVTEDEVRNAFGDFVQSVPPESQAAAQKEFDSKGQLYEEIRWRALVEKVITGLLA